MARRRKVSKGCKKVASDSADNDVLVGDDKNPTKSLPITKGKRKTSSASSDTSPKDGELADPPLNKKKRSNSPKTRKSSQKEEDDDDGDGEWKPTDTEQSENSDEDSKPAANKRSSSTKRAKEKSETEEERDNDSEYLGGDFNGDSKPAAHGEKNKDSSVGDKKDDIICPTCKKVFASRGGLKYHVDKKVCHEEQQNKVFKCPTCEKEFSMEKRFQNHIDLNTCRPKSTKKKTPGKQQSKSKEGSSKKHPKLQDEDGNKTPESNEKNSGGSKIDPDEEKRKTTKKRKLSQTGGVGVGRAPEKFEQLKPGSTFYTKYGVVEVVADDKLPPNHRTSSTVCKNKVRCFDKRKERFIAKQEKLRDEIAVGTRHRREELKKMYMQTKDTSAVSAVAQKKMWGFYCASLTSKEILDEGMSWRGNNHKTLKGKKIEFMPYDNEDPRCPKDFYADRIVECKLVADTQEIIAGTNVEGKDGEYHEEYHTIKRAQKAKDMVVPKMSLFVSRKDLIRVYNASKPRYICGSCGNSYLSNIAGLKYHLNTHCSPIEGVEQKEREKRVKAVDTKALTEGSCCVDKCLKTLHGVITSLDVKVEDLPADFGNPHKIKDHKKHKMPPWLVFNVDRSSMYPETYVALEYRRGSQNRNHFTKMKMEEGYIPKSEKSRLRKRLRKIRMIDPGAKSFAPIVWKCPKCTREFRYTTPNCVAACTGNHLKTCDGIPPKVVIKKTPVKRDAKPHTTLCINPAYPEKASSSPALPPPLPPVPGIHQAVGSQHTSTQPSAKKRSAKKARAKSNTNGNKSAESPPPLPPVPGIDNMDVDLTTYTEPMSVDDPNDLSDGKETSSRVNKTPAESSRRRKRVMVSKKKSTIVVDTQVLATECDSGRYPSINRFDGVHETQCVLCKKDEDEPLIYCDYCKNSVHQICLDKRMLGKEPQVVIRENEPHDTPMCHDCISVCMFRRSRAENRRLSKWQHELLKAGLDNVPEAASLTEEVKIKDKNEVPREDDEPTYKPCPDGGPGGLICCSYCTAAYSRFLSNTAKEMEAQSVAKAGQEVSEIMELLADAKMRLERASGVSQENELRRGLLDKNQSAHQGLSVDD